jgi:predicted RNA-binding Zn ribbon-like protein
MVTALPKLTLRVNLVLVVTTPTPLEQLELAGGDLALDFANTVEGPRDGPATTDHLGDYDDVVAWAQRAGAVDDATARALARRAARHPAQAASALASAHRLRDALGQTFGTLARGAAPPVEALVAVRDAAADAVLASRPAPGALCWEERDLERPLWPVAVAGLDLLRDESRLERLKVCANCCWVFLDASRNRSRRWCSMNECGVHDKMRRYRARRAAARG